MLANDRVRVACCDSCFVYYVLSHALFLKWAYCVFRTTAIDSALVLCLVLPSYMCIVLSDYRLNIAHAAITYFYCISVEGLMQVVVQWKVLVNNVKKITPYISADIHAKMVG